MSRLLTKTELAAELRVSERTVYRYLDDGCPHFRIRKRSLFDLDEVKEWMRSPANPACQSEKTRTISGTSSSASLVNAYTAASRRVQLRVMPKASTPS
jgi:excisionase family DNA binding protein